VWQSTLAVFRYKYLTDLFTFKRRLSGSYTQRYKVRISNSLNNWFYLRNRICPVDVRSVCDVFRSVVRRGASESMSAGLKAWKHECHPQHRTWTVGLTASVNIFRTVSISHCSHFPIDCVFAYDALTKHWHQLLSEKSTSSLPLHYALLLCQLLGRPGR